MPVVLADFAETLAFRLNNVVMGILDPRYTSTLMLPPTPKGISIQQTSQLTKKIIVKG
jgi:hypothetical protein